MRLISCVLMFFILGAVPVPASADMVANCNFGLNDYSDRGSVMVYDRNGGVVMQMVLDGDVSVFPKVKISTATGDQVRDQAKKDTKFNKELADSHIFPSDVTLMRIYVSDPAPTPGDTPPFASYDAFYGANNVFLGGFGVLGSDGWVCDWQ